MVVEEKRVTWYSRIWSWTPASLWDAAIEKAGQVPAAASATTIDFEECPPFRGMESVKRRNAVRNRNRKGRQHYNTYGLTRNSSKNDGWETETPLSEIKTPVKTMFDWYHPWKMESTEKTISLLPATQQPVFRDSIAGNCEQLQQYLESLEFIVDTSTVVNFADEKGRRAIHFASAFGHFDIIELLLSYGANPNALDSSNSITPLACGAVNGNEKIMELLITKGANINYGLERDYRTDAESESHTALSWAVRTENAKSVKYLLEKGALLAGTTINWETPLHEAAYLGNIDILKLLVQNERNLQSLELRGGKDKNTPLNVAVEQGHLDCMEFLLSVGAKPNKFNIYGQTSLQLSAMTKDFQAIQLLIKNGADVNTRDTRNRTPLHHCIQFASLSNYVEAIQCIETLLYNGADINAQDENGFTPFNTAVDNGASTIVATLLKQGADLTITNNAGQSGVEILVKKMPHAIRYIRESLDFAIFVKQNDIADPDCTISFDFRPIIVTNNNEDVKTSTPRKETEVLLSFCAFGHYDILSHPLVEAFLVLKWERVMKYFWASFIANLLMVLVYSYFVFHLYASMCPLTAQNVTVTTPENILIEIEMPDYLQMIWYLLCLMIFVFTIKELVQLVLSPKSYFKMGENYIQLIFIILALLTILPDPLGPVNFKGDICHCLNRWNHIHYRSAAVSVVVAWFLILLRIGKLPKLGLYVQMFFKVVGNFGLFVIAYSSIVIGFTLSFGILLDDVNDEWVSPLVIFRG
ncbi:transient receptor potential channel pyrexia isoform X2 [Folsomia candida]|uniref:transient receptor potential channel pyrexia isoform X2 n=1 Tax=Folsomia candida TaxID=158441 RepID=UPI001605082C|nr:transient receptor potential channel pyrexia isoform X2 [Folsomia candida]